MPSRSRAAAFVGSALLAAALGLAVGRNLARQPSAPPRPATPPPAPGPEQYWQALPSSDALDDRLAVAYSIAKQPKGSLPKLVQAAYNEALAAGKPPFSFRTSAALVRWSEKDPDAAMRWALATEASPERDTAQRDILTVWASVDPGGLAQWLEVSCPLPSSDKRGFEKKVKSAISDDLLRIAISQLSKSDLTTAIDLAGKIGGTNWLASTKEFETAEAVAAAADAVMKLPRNGFDLRGGSGDGGTTGGVYTSNQRATYAPSRLLDEIAARWDELDPTGYAEAVSSGRFKPARFTDDPKRFAPTDDESFQDAAERALASAISPEQRRAALFASTELWAKEDPDAAGTWLGEQGIANDPDTWPAVRSFARAAGKYDPDAALAWARQIGDPDIRRGAFIDAATAWGAANRGTTHDTSSWPPELAKAWAALAATASR